MVALIRVDKLVFEDIVTFVELAVHRYDKFIGALVALPIVVLSLTLVVFIVLFEDLSDPAETFGAILSNSAYNIC